MPELNPLSNEQIFLKKIAENTGSNYNTGDVSEINPLTIDQILLREIAANTAGQAGDISELVEKVTDLSYTMAANGAHNLLPLTLEILKANNTLGTWNNNVYTYRGVDFTVNSDLSITINGTATNEGDSLLTCNFIAKANVGYLANGTPTGAGHSTWGMFENHSGGYSYIEPDEDLEVSFSSDTTVQIVLFVRTGQTCSNKTFYPMIRLATDPSTEYTPYAMTNRELTEQKAEVKTVTETLTTNANYWILFPEGRTILNAYISNTWNTLFLVRDYITGKYLTRWYVDFNANSFVPSQLDANTAYSITYDYI